MILDQKIIDRYDLDVGLEVHVQLKTKSKIFSSDVAIYGDDPNQNIGFVTLAHPGALPKLNKEVIGYAIKMGFACHCEISTDFIFDRKNYFYPDLPKGYQLTQDRTPICVHGYVPVKTLSGGERDIHLFKIHLEEDAGKSIHVPGSDRTQVDYNRAGTPLIEIVTQPDIHHAEEASAVLTAIRRLVRYLGISDGNMEEGSMRCDANISVRKKGSSELGKKVEIKNMNSMRNVARAIEHERKRQIAILEDGEEVISETRTFIADRGITRGMRTKEELNDYRYFPEPDLSAVHVSDQWMKQLKDEMPPLPEELFRLFTESYKLPEYNAAVLIDDPGMAIYAKAVFEQTKNHKSASNWLMGPVKSYLNDRSMQIADFPLRPDALVALVDLVETKVISHTAASQQVFPELLKQPEAHPKEVAEALGVLTEDGDEESLGPIIASVINEWPDKVKAYQKGKKGLIGFFMGEMMKKTQGKIDPKSANAILREALDTVEVGK
ncbi:MAG: Asp-tRNA(Asn)/Glu-tRNA(Gln) amidotransferase subunit GatB [Bacteroidota bacterium]